MLLVAAILLAFFVLPQPWGFVAVFVGGAVEVAEGLFWIRLSRRLRPQVGAEALVGAEATVVSPCHPEGRVRVHGELWNARCEGGAEPGDTVRVSGLEGLTLLVERT
jgi:membrane-bound serine protease (ClpP class)